MGNGIQLNVSFVTLDLVNVKFILFFPSMNFVPFTHTKNHKTNHKKWNK